MQSAVAMELARGTTLSLLAAASAMVIGCSEDNQNPSTRKNLCEIGTYCDEAAPPPIVLEISERPARLSSRLRTAFALAFPHGGEIYQVGPEGDEGWTDKNGVVHFYRRMFFVKESDVSKAGSIWIVFEHIADSEPEWQILSDDFDPQLSVIKTHDQSEGRMPSLFEVSLINRASEIGPIFQIDGYNGSHIRHEAHSDYVRKKWEHHVTSSCGGGLLTCVPQEWEQERLRDCRLLEQGRPDRMKQGGGFQT
jgi:hypothetical protein